MSEQNCEDELNGPFDHPGATTFDLDDAFSDGDDHEAYDFSRDAIREELARNLPSDDDHWAAHETVTSSNAFFEAHDTSVSTLDISGLGREASSPPHSPDEFGAASQFSQISLSEDTGLEGACARADEHDAQVEQELGSEFSEEYLERDSHSTHTPQSSDDWNVHYQNPKPEVQARHEAEYLNVIINASKTLEDHEASTIEKSPTLAVKRGFTASNHELNISPSHDSEHLSMPRSPHSMPSSPHLSASSAPPATPPVTPRPRSHRSNRSVGPSVFEQVMSKTRPSFLPPKTRQEDDKHLADWRAMMKLSRAAAEKKRRALQERRLQREKKVEESLQLWEKEIVPDWKVVYKNPGLRRVWWSGIPTKLRATMWERAVGNALALSKDNYRACLARAKRALSSGRFPTTVLSMIEEDIANTLPSLHIFRTETGPLYQDLKDMLCAWAVSRSDEGLGYTMGISKIAAMFLLNMPAQQGFVVMRNLLERHCLRSFFGGEATKDDVEAYYRIFDTLLADGMPKIYFNFKQHQISPSSYLLDWLLPLFLDHLPFEACARIWDVLLLEGDSFLYRAALGILAVLEPRLFFPDRRELLELLRGENKAALDVAKREGYSLEGGKYEIYGVDEETLWERINGMDDWWKQSTWTRLIQRELPDL